MRRSPAAKAAAQRKSSKQRKQWGLGDPLTGRDAAARTFSHALTLDTPRDPGTWPVADARPAPDYIQDALALGQTLSTLGKAAFNGIRAYAEQNNIKIDGLPADPDAGVLRPSPAHHPQLPGHPVPAAAPGRTESGRRGHLSRAQGKNTTE